MFTQVLRNQFFPGKTFSLIPNNNNESTKQNRGDNLEAGRSWRLNYMYFECKKKKRKFKFNFFLNTA